MLGTSRDVDQLASISLTRLTHTAMLLQVWLKPAAEQSFLYGNNVLKVAHTCTPTCYSRACWRGCVSSLCLQAGLGRVTEDTPQYQGCVVLSMADVPLGFGVRRLVPTLTAGRWRCCACEAASGTGLAPGLAPARRVSSLIPRLAGGGEVDRRVPQARPAGRGRLPPGGHRRVPPRRGGPQLTARLRHSVHAT